MWNRSSLVVKGRMSFFGIYVLMLLMNIVTIETTTRKENVIHVPSNCQKHVKLHKDNTDDRIKLNVSGNASQWIHHSKGKSCDIKITKNIQYQFPAVCYQLIVNVESDEDDKFNRCHFDILLYSGEIQENQPLKRVPCNRNKSLVLDWPSPTAIVSLLPTNCGHNANISLSDIGRNVVIGLSLHAKNECEHGISEMRISFKEASCGGKGCLDSNNQGYQMSADSTDTRVCSFNISLHRGPRVCLKQNFVDKQRWHACRFIKWHTYLFVDGKLFMTIGCDDIHNWWCIPRNFNGNTVSFRWQKDWRQCSSKNNIQVISLSEYTETQQCGSRYTPIATNVTTQGLADLAEHDKYIAIIILIAILLLLLIAMLLVLRSLVEKMRGRGDQNNQRSRQVSVVSFSNNPPPYPGKLSKTNLNYLPSYQSALELPYYNTSHDRAVNNSLGTQSVVQDETPYAGESSPVRYMSSCFQSTRALPVDRSFNMYNGNSIRASFVIGDETSFSIDNEIRHQDTEQSHSSPTPLLFGVLCSTNRENVPSRPNIYLNNSSKDLASRRKMYTTSFEQRRSDSDTTNLSEDDVEKENDDVTT